MKMYVIGTLLGVMLGYLIGRICSINDDSEKLRNAMLTALYYINSVKPRISPPSTSLWLAAATLRNALNGRK